MFTAVVGFVARAYPAQLRDGDRRPESVESRAGIARLSSEGSAMDACQFEGCQVRQGIVSGDSHPGSAVARTLFVA